MATIRSSSKAATSVTPPGRIQLILTSTREHARTIAVNAVLVIFSLVTLVPFLWMVLSSFKNGGEIVQVPPTFLPQAPTVANYQAVLFGMDFLRYALNSLVVAVPSTIIVLYTSSSAGYVFAKYRFTGKDNLFLIVLSTMMIPFAVVLIPLFLLISNVGWLNSYQGMIVPTMVSAFGIFLMRQFIEGIPDELLQAARIDGANEWWIFLRIVAPLSTSALSALTIFHFLAVWDGFLWPLAVISEPHMRTLPLGLAGLQGERGTRYDLTLAGAVVTILPILLVYAVAQKQFIRGITMTGLKM